MFVLLVVLTLDSAAVAKAAPEDNPIKALSDSPGGASARPEKSPVVPPRRHARQVRQPSSEQQQSPVVPPHRLVRQGRPPAPSPSEHLQEASPASKEIRLPLFALNALGSMSATTRAVPSGLDYLPSWRCHAFMLLLVAYGVYLARKFQIFSKWVRLLCTNSAGAIGSTRGESSARDIVTVTLRVANVDFKQLASHPAVQEKVKRAVRDIVKQVPSHPVEIIDLQMYEELDCRMYVQVVVGAATGTGDDLKAALGAQRFCEGVAAAVCKVESVGQMLLGRVGCKIVHGPELALEVGARCC